MIKPILFNTEMVRAMLEGRKTVTRRLVKPQPPEGVKELSPGTRAGGTIWRSPGVNVWAEITPPYQPGDILWVRETWQFTPCIDCSLDAHTLCGGDPVTYEDKDSIGEGCFVYREDYPEPERICWHPSIHMPREAARLFLRVKSVRVERLREMVLEDVLMEGVQEADSFKSTWERWHNTWDSTIKPADRDRYGWSANPWVWVIRFELVKNPIG